MHFVKFNSVDVLALTETKLDDSIHSSLYTIPNFHQPFTRHRTRRGGGTALYAHNSLPFTRLPDLELPGEEWIWGMIKTTQAKIIVCSIYLPPNLSTTRLQEFLDRFTESLTLAVAHSPKAIFIVGDFNAGNIYLLASQNRHSGITIF